MSRDWDRRPNKFKLKYSFSSFLAWLSWRLFVFLTLFSSDFELSRLAVYIERIFWQLSMKMLSLFFFYSIKSFFRFQVDFVPGWATYRYSQRSTTQFLKKDVCGFALMILFLSLSLRGPSIDDWSNLVLVWHCKHIWFKSKTKCTAHIASFPHISRWLTLVVEPLSNQWLLN